MALALVLLVFRKKKSCCGCSAVVPRGAVLQPQRFFFEKVVKPRNGQLFREKVVRSLVLQHFPKIIAVAAVPFVFPSTWDCESEPRLGNTTL